MKRMISLLLCALLILGSFGGCSRKSDTAQEIYKAEENIETTQSAKEPVIVNIWHDNDENLMSVMETKLNESLKADGITVKFTKKSGIQDQLKLYGNDAANGPDMYFAAHDTTGNFAEMGILAPITDFISEGDMADMFPVTVEAGNYKNVQYQMPTYFEALLLIYNKDLWKGEVPSTTDELYNYMVANTDTKAGTYALVNQHSTAYNVAPVINGFGGYIINLDAQPGLNEQATKDAITYNQKFAKLQADGDYNTVTTLFNEKKAAAIIGGPWLITGIKAAGINTGFKSLSEIKLPNGNALAPWVGVQGLFVLKHAEDTKKAAITKVLVAAAAPEIGVELAKSANCAPVNAKAYDDAEVAANEMIAAIKATSATAQPMPNITEMGVMWAPAESLLAAVNKSGEDLNKSAEKYQKEALSAIADMQ